MKVIVAGSRSIKDYKTVCSAIMESGFEIEEVVSGGASGVDSLGEHWAAEHNLSMKRFPADWTLGKAGGYIRNKQMAEYADALVAVWDGQSKGTQHMVNLARERGLLVFVKRTDEGLF